MKSLATLLKSLNKGLLKDVLTGAGLTLATSGTTLIVFNRMLNNFKSNVNSIPHEILALAHISGFDVFFSLILGAYVTRFTLNSNNLTLQKIKR